MPLAWSTRAFRKIRCFLACHPRPYQAPPDCPPCPVNTGAFGSGTSWHFGLEFTEHGPVAYGLLSYSQSTDSQSPYFSDQSERYANKDYRPLLFSEADIAANVLPGGTMELEGTQSSTD